MELSEQNRQRLDGIVQQMIANNEPDENIRFVVDDFKKKYSAPTAPPPQPGTPPMLTDIFTGAAKGVGSTAYGLTELANKGIRMIPGAERFVPPMPAKPEMLKPSGTLEKIGYGGEQIGEFFLPGGAVRKGVAALKGAPKFAPWVAKAGLEAASAAGVTAAQTGGDKEAMALAGGLAGGTTGAGKLIEWGGKKLATKMVESQVKATLRNYESGFSGENIFKYNLGGTLRQTAKKTADLIRQKSNELKTALSGNPATVDVMDAIARTEDELLGTTASKAKNIGMIKAMRTSLSKWTDELMETSPSGELNLLDANMFKRQVGHAGAWKYGGRDFDSVADERVANSLYTHIRGSIERAARDPNIQRINKELSELLPIEAATIRRLPIDQRQNAISLVMAITSLPAAAGAGGATTALPALYWASKSPYIANWIQKFKSTGTTGRVAAGAAGLSRQSGQP